MQADDLLLFARVVEAGSFSRAAEWAGLPKSTVSRRIAALEKRLGEALLLRTTRRLGLTDFGQGLLEHARRLAEEVDAARALAEHRQAEPRGRLRVSMPSDFAALLLPQMLADFSLRYPGIALELDLSARRVDLIAEQFDLALRAGELADDATLVARRLCRFQVGLVASPGYLARHGVPQHPSDLTAHRALRLLGNDGEPRPWRLACGQEHWEGQACGNLSANSLGLLIRLAATGAGIAGVAGRFVAHEIAAGSLVPVLPHWSLPCATMWAVTPGRRLLPARTRVFMDALRAVLPEAG